MTQITSDHLEWAVVGRLGRMLNEPPHREFNVTQAYALFTAILCWVVQHGRVPKPDIVSSADRSARDFFTALSVPIAEAPWCLYVKPAERIEVIGRKQISVPAPANFEDHTAKRFFTNLRDATAHGDARNVKPFNVDLGREHLLAGFRFACSEYPGPRSRTEPTWTGEITLLESDLRRLGTQLAKRYCDALRRNASNREDGHFGHDAASLKEAAA